MRSSGRPSRLPPQVPCKRARLSQDRWHVPLVPVIVCPCRGPDGRMTHTDKVALFRDEMETKGVSAWTSAPPVYRLCWRFGVRVRPPHFQGFLLQTILFGVYFGVVWGVAMWFILWRWVMSPSSLPWLPVGSAFGAGLFFGLSMATYFRWQARRLGLPSWDRYPSA